MNDLLRKDLEDLPDAFHGALATARANRPTAATRQRIVLTGSGDCLFAARSLRGPLQRELGLEIDPQAPLAVASQPVIASEDVVVALSFSGSAERTIAAARRAHDFGARVLAITSNADSELASIADEMVPIDWTSHSRALPHCADHMATIAALLATAEGLAHQDLDLRGTRELATESQRASERATSWAEAAADASWVHFLAPGEKLPVAEYAAAKLWESAGQRATAFELEEFGHGPHLIVEPDDTIAIVAADNAADDAIASATAWGAEVGATVTRLRRNGDTPQRDGGGVPPASDVLEVLFDHLPPQWFTLALADARGVEVSDGPPRLQ